MKRGREREREKRSDVRARMKFSTPPPRLCRACGASTLKGSERQTKRERRIEE